MSTDEARVPVRETDTGGMVGERIAVGYGRDVVDGIDWLTRTEPVALRVSGPPASPGNRSRISCARCVG